MPPSALRQFARLLPRFTLFESQCQLNCSRLEIDRELATGTDSLIEQFPEVFEPLPPVVADFVYRVLLAGLLHEEARTRIDAQLISETTAIAVLLSAYEVGCWQITCRHMQPRTPEKMQAWATARFNEALRELRKNSE